MGLCHVPSPPACHREALRKLDGGRCPEREAQGAGRGPARGRQLADPLGPGWPRHPTRSSLGAPGSHGRGSGGLGLRGSRGGACRPGQHQPGGRRGRYSERGSGLPALVRKLVACGLLGTLATLDPTLLEALGWARRPQGWGRRWGHSGPWASSAPGGHRSPFSGRCGRLVTEAWSSAPVPATVRPLRRRGRRVTAEARRPEAAGQSGGGLGTLPSSPSGLTREPSAHFPRGETEARGRGGGLARVRGHTSDAQTSRPSRPH